MEIELSEVKDYTVSDACDILKEAGEKEVKEQEDDVKFFDVSDIFGPNVFILPVEKETDVEEKGEDE